jgi:hypothetical protein
VHAATDGWGGLRNPIGVGADIVGRLANDHSRN